MGVTRLQPGACCGCVTVCSATICVTTATGTAISGASITIKNGSTTVASCTTPSSGCCTLTINTAGSYTVVVSASGYATNTQTMSLSCGGSYTVQLCPSNDCVTFAVQGCGVNVPNATVTVDGPGGTVYTGTTGGSGSVCIPLPATGTYTYSVSMTRYQTATGTFNTVSACYPTTVNVSLTPASGYYCCCNAVGANDYLPRPATLHLTDSVYGAVTLTYDAGDGTWKGSLAVTFPGGCQCPTTQSVTLWYQWGNPGAGCGIYVYCNTTYIGGYPCPQTSSIGGTQVPQSGGSGYTQSGPTLNASANFLGCTPCLGIAPGSCGGGVDGDVIYQADSVTITVTE